MKCVSLVDCAPLPMGQSAPMVKFNAGYTRLTPSCCVAAAAAVALLNGHFDNSAIAPAAWGCDGPRALVLTSPHVAPALVVAVLTRVFAPDRW